MPRTQTLVQLNDELLAALDERRARDGRSRSELIREAIERFLADDERARIDAAIVEGYTRIPPTDEFDAMQHAAARAMIDAEPW